MSGYPHGLTAPHDDAPPGNDYVLRGTEIKPVLHTTDWRDQRAKVQWCGGKYLFEPVVLEAGETKTCPMCAIELHYDRAKKEVVEGGFPKVPNRTGGGMKVREALEKRRWFMALRIGGDREKAVEDFEVALRAAWEKGWENRKLHRHLVPNPDYGVTAGVAAMMEKPNE